MNGGRQFRGAHGQRLMRSHMSSDARTVGLTLSRIGSMFTSMPATLATFGMRRAVVVPTTTALLVLLAELTGIGSTCFTPPLPEAVSGAAIILHGRVTRVDYLDTEGAPEPTKRQTTDSLCGQKLVTFEVKRLLKGEARHDVTAFAEDGCVGLGGYFRVGEEFVVLMRASGDRMAKYVMSRSSRDQARPLQWTGPVLHACSGTRRISPPSGVGSDEGVKAYIAEIMALLSRSPQQ